MTINILIECISRSKLLAFVLSPFTPPARGGGDGGFHSYNCQGPRSVLSGSREFIPLWSE